MIGVNDKLLSWASVIEPGTLEQAERTARMPFVQPHLALMPDAHLGKGSTVGSVIPTAGAIMPAAVGVDIGCGMMAVRTQLTRTSLGDDLRPLRERIERAVPLGAGAYNNEKTQATDMRVGHLLELDDVLRHLGAGGADGGSARVSFYDGLTRTSWYLQLGSLGGGNHFIEVVLDENDDVWLFLHSGSRGIGNQIAQYHIKVAKDFCRRAYITLEDPDLAYLVEGTPEFDLYMRDMAWAMAFAYLNREEMMDRVIIALHQSTACPVEVLERVNCHHNFTQRERHMGRDLWVTRKGAISAREGELGLIPGSMGTASFVVEGKGNVLSFHSAPHGAGRAHSRAEARRRFTMDQMRDAMKGVEYRETEAFLDEIPAAYKDIDQVMLDAAGLVEVKHVFRQVVNVKGE
jgi:tRNA-splicing ligase RtcB (3'-phosphate/5'-hydroxy nucleic acid ligase)